MSALAVPIELVAATADAPIWERLKGESRASFQNFIAYRDQTRGRHSMRRCAADLGKSLSTLKVQAVKYRWQERVDAYEDYLDRRDRELRESERAEFNRRGVQVANQLMGVGMSRLVGREARGGQQAVQALNPSELEPGDVARMIEVGWRMGRLGTGQATDAIGGAGSFSTEDMRKMYDGMFELGLRLIPEDRHARYASEVRSFLETGRLSPRE